jgi:mRNA interferase RelE/StbE
MYAVKIEKQALKYITRLDSVNAKRMRDAIDLIAANPSIGKKLTKHGTGYSYRVGDFRILYDKYDDHLVIIIVKVQGRGNVYNN